MGANTKIEWCDFTFNPWRGCQKVAPGCANCYAEAQSKRNPKTLGIWGPSGTRVVASEATWREPVKWNKAAAILPDAIVRPGSLPVEYVPVGRPRVFCASLADVFEDWQGPMKDASGHPLHHAKAWGMPGVWAGVANTFIGRSLVKLDDVRARLFRLIDATPNLDWLLLTKRPENIRRMVHDSWTEKVPGHVSQNDGDGRRWKRRENVWLGTSIACQEDAERNVPELLKCRDLCAKLFVSIEPLVGPVDISSWVGCFHESTDPNQNDHSECAATANWMIVGGESGPNARPCDIAWIRSIVRQCKDAGVPVFVKQLGAKPTEYIVTAVGKDVYGNVDDDGRYEVVDLRDPKGGDPSEWPEDLRVREVPS